MKEAHSENRQLPGVQTKQTLRPMGLQLPLSGIGTLALPGTLISTFCGILYLSLPGLADPLRFPAGTRISVER